MISSFLPTCASCGVRGEYTSRDNTPPHKLAQRDGWHVKARSYVCENCYNREHGLEVKADEQKKKTSEGLESLRRAIEARTTPSEGV